MKLFLSSLIFFLLSSCKSSDDKAIEGRNNLPDSSAITLDKSTKYLDTATLDGKRAFILNKFLTVGEIQRHADFDTLIDLTYDGNKDYIIGYYGSTGTGIKNRIEAFLFDPKTNSYLLDTMLSDLANPTFYIDKKKITSFYIGNGGGGGSKLEWLNNKWTETKSFTVDKQDTDAVWVVTLPLKNKTTTTRRAFQMVPPDDILESDVKE